MYYKKNAISNFCLADFQNFSVDFQDEDKKNVLSKNHAIHTFFKCYKRTLVQLKRKLKVNSHMQLLSR